MKISALEEYGLRCLLRVARQADDGPVSAQVIAEREGLSVPYAQKIMRILSQGDLVDSRRGANGGYVLARPVEEISVGDAIAVLGGVFGAEDICERHTGELDTCAHGCDCAIRPVWEHIEAFIVRTLNGLSLEMLLKDEHTVESHLQRVAPFTPELLCPVGPVAAQENG